MHDIICPHCGEKFIARDVAFDLSEYILPLLCDNSDDLDDVKDVGFKFYVDEDTILNNTTPDNTVPLICEKPGGPDHQDPRFPFVVTNKMLFEYIESQVVLGVSLSELMNVINQNTRSSTYTTTQLNCLEAIFRRFFRCARKMVGRFDADDDDVKTVIKMLLHIYKNPTETINLQVRLECVNLVPDTLYVVKVGFGDDRLKKCCRYCGASFPTEFGSYKMIPVVLIGSHYAGKTSFLLSLLYTAQELAPFAQDGVGKRTITAKTLKRDADLEAFSVNIGRFKQGMDPDKTAFADIEVPILNLLVNDIIYSFIDWPGEKFIDGSVIHDDTFIHQTRRVIRKARHFFCFLEPSQIDMNRKQSEERVRFSANELADRFEEHMLLTYPEEKAFNKLRSITYIVNKIDLFMGDENNQPNPNANMILDIYRNKSELSVYSEGKWNKSEFNTIDQTTRQFLQIENPTLYNNLADMGKFKGIPTAFVPVAPYGEHIAQGAGQIVHNTRLAGIPLLRIMELDKPLTAKRS